MKSRQQSRNLRLKRDSNRFAAIGTESAEEDLFGLIQSSEETNGASAASVGSSTSSDGTDGRQSSKSTSGQQSSADEKEIEREEKGTDNDIRAVLAGLQVALDNKTLPWLDSLEREAWIKFLPEFRRYQRSRGATPLLDCMSDSVVMLLGIYLGEEYCLPQLRKVSEESIIRAVSDYFAPASSTDIGLSLAKVRCTNPPSRKNVNRYIQLFTEELLLLPSRLPDFVEAAIFLQGLPDVQNFRDRVRRNVQARAVNTELLCTTMRAAIGEADTTEKAIQHLRLCQIDSWGIHKQSGDREFNKSRDTPAEGRAKGKRPEAPDRPYQPHGCYNCSDPTHSVKKCPFQWNPARIEANKTKKQAKSTTPAKVSLVSTGASNLLTSGVLAKQPVSVLVDTGATISLISESVVLAAGLLRKACVREFANADRTVTTLTSLVDAELCIPVTTPAPAWKTIPTTFYVCETGYDIVVLWLWIVILH